MIKLQEISEEDVLEAHLTFEDMLENKISFNSISTEEDLECFQSPLNHGDLLPASAPHASVTLDLLVDLLPPNSWLATHLATTVAKVTISHVIEQFLKVSQTFRATVTCTMF